MNFSRNWQEYRKLDGHIAKLASDIYEWAKEKGFWDGEANDGEKIALMHSELSEALEFLRHRSPPSDHIPEFSGVEEELADLIIRVFDFAAHRHLRVFGALIAKMEYNETRPYMHGKKF